MMPLFRNTKALHLIMLTLLIAPVSSLAQQYPTTTTQQGASQQGIPELDCVIEPSEIVNAGSAVPGLIDAVYADRSDILNKGVVIAQLESSVERATLARARAQAQTSTSIQLREETVKLGKVTQKRNEELLYISAISQHDMDQLKTENRIAALQYEQEKHNKRIAELEYQRAQAALERLTIRSPIDGVVMDRYKTSGEFIDDEPVLRIAKLDPLFVEVVVPVTYLGQITPGMTAEVLPTAGGQIKHVATVERVDKVADAASGTYGVRLSLANPDYSVSAGLRCKLAFLPPQPGQQNTTTNTSQRNRQTDTDTRTAATKPATTPPPAAAKQQSVPAWQQQPSLADQVVEFFPGQLHTKTMPTPAQHQVISISASSPADAGHSHQACYSLGPIATEPQAQQLSTQFAEMTATTAAATETSIHNEPVDVTKAYFILAEAMPSLEESRQLLDRIRAAGITDSAIVRSKTFKGRVSLGYYSKYASALRHQTVVANKGFATKIVPHTSSKNQYWLDVTVSESTAAKNQLQQLADSLSPSLSLKALTCSPQMAQR